MRVLVLSDIHSNLEALDACLRAAPSHDLVVNLGDIVGYGASPNEAAERSRELGHHIVRGNHDKACTGQMDLHDFNPVAAAAALWTQESLKPENLEWLSRVLPGPMPLTEAQLVADSAASRESATAEVPLLVHGSPLDEDEYVISIADALDVLMRSSVRLTFFGHTHIQGGFSLRADVGGQSFRPGYSTQDEREEISMSLAAGTRYLINPGSVGQPRDGDWRAAFLMFDNSASQVTFYRVPYDIAGAQKRIVGAKLPARLASRLSEGR
ncbi:MAG TPA: metallophosphoesterase family protein [Terriglobales bacterium]|nr:metallophosphoesterase family protein [Terriglobales bacterium]